MHQAADGSCMLGLSLPMELLLMEEGPSATLDDIYHALDSRSVEVLRGLCGLSPSILVLLTSS